jgi:hypothetical protein
MNCGEPYYYEISCICGNDAQVARVKYLINENYSILILIKIKHCTCLMIGNFFEMSVCHKQCAS